MRPVSRMSACSCARLPASGAESVSLSPGDRPVGFQEDDEDVRSRHVCEIRVERGRGTERGQAGAARFVDELARLPGVGHRDRVGEPEAVDRPPSELGRREQPHDRGGRAAEQPPPER